jgi:prepilin-type N-terminal cleavage/methylation domain-containing protein/prepilin-type processing-associated H-X9-DG protein
MTKLFKGRTGFTLVELLVVIAVIAVLAAILYPVFLAAREKARQTGCASNLKQIGTAFQMYLQDYDGMFPENTWPQDQPNPVETYGITPYYTKLFPYVRNWGLFVCPSRGNGKWGLPQSEGLPNTEGHANCYISSYPQHTPGTTDEQFRKVSYAYNNQLAVRTHEVQIANATRLPMLWDGNSIWSFAGPGLGYEPVLTAGEHGHGVECYPPAFEDGSTVMRHSAGLNILFSDGHVKYVAWNQLRQPRYCTLKEHL